jgi:putative transposase
MADLRNRGVRDILIACCDGLAGFEDAIGSAFPAAVVQRCVVHLARERLARRQQAGRRADQPARLVEGQRVMGWREALNELDGAYPGRLQ